MATCESLSKHLITAGLSHRWYTNKGLLCVTFPESEGVVRLGYETLGANETL
jgi:hypothetical protein